MPARAQRSSSSRCDSVSVGRSLPELDAQRRMAPGSGDGQNGASASRTVVSWAAVYPYSGAVSVCAAAQVVDYHALMPIVTNGHRPVRESGANGDDGEDNNGQPDIATLKCGGCESQIECGERLRRATARLVVGRMFAASVSAAR